MPENQTEDEKPIVKIKHHSYQPSKAELEQDMRIKATPEELLAAVMNFNPKEHR